MTKLTVREERNCQYLLDEGYDYLSNSMRESYVREHEVFEELKHVDVDALYGPAVTEAMRNAMKKAIADGDRAVVRSLHSLCLTMDKPKERSVVRRESSSPLGANLGFSLLVFAALIVLIPLFLGL
jgi:hypothetical protein